MAATVETQDVNAEDRIVAAAVGEAAEVLDCGCGSGRIARQLRGVQVDGIELSEASARAARGACRTVVHGSMTDPASYGALAGRTYDVVVFCHVLEHLPDPLSAVRLASAHLKPRGRIVVVLPNVATWRMRWTLLQGRWDYTDEGTLDRTHVCFYTLKTARELLARAGLRVEKETLLGGLEPAGGWARRALVGALRKTSRVASAQAFLFVTELAEELPRR